MSLMFALLTVTASCVPSASPAESNDQVVRNYFGAINAYDHAALSRYIKPGATYAEGPGRRRWDLAELMSALPDDGNTFEIVSLVLQDDGIVVIRTRTSQGAERKARVTLDGGCVAAIDQVAE